MAKRMSAGGKAALITGACLIGLAAVGTGLYFGVAAIREKVDDVAAKTGTVTLKNLWHFDLDDPTDEQRESLTIKDGVITNSRESIFTLNSSVVFDFEPGQIFNFNFVPIYVSASHVESTIEPNTLINVGAINEDIDDLPYTFTSYGDLVEKGHLVTEINAKGTSVAFPYCYRVSELGYNSKKKCDYVFGKLTQDMKTIKGDLTFKKADVLKYADAYEESLKAAASSTTAATSSAA